MNTSHPFTARTARRLWVLFGIILAGTLLAEAFVSMHGPDSVSHSFGFNAWYGFLSCVALVGVSRLVGLLLKRKDTWYDG